MCGLAKLEPLSAPLPIANNSQLAKQEILSVISHLIQFKHLLCGPCKSVVLYKTLYYYLRYYYNIRYAFCKAIVSKYENVSVSQTNTDVTPLLARTPPLDYLPSPELGYFCLHCDYITVN